jgi:hypothetical protein
VTERDVPVGSGIHGHDATDRAKALGPKVPGSTHPPRADRRTLEERLDTFAGTLVVVVVRQDEALAARRSRVAVMRRGRVCGKVGHGRPV